MTTTRRLAALFCFLLCLGTTAPVALKAQAPAADGKKERVIPQLEFHNTQIRELVEYLRQQVPEANIVIQRGAGDIRVSELQLRNVTLTQALLALPFATRHEVAVNLPREQAPDMFTIVDMRNEAAQTVTEVLHLPPWPEADFDKRLAAALDAINHLYALSRNAQMAAGDTDVELKPPSVEMHRPTRLLLVAGSHEGVELVRRVITALLQQPPGAAAPDPKPDNAVKATVLGQVQKPGVYTVEDGTLAQLIAHAGGVTSNANAKQISVSSKDGKKIDVDLSTPAGVTIKEGDTVTVPARAFPPE